MSSCKNSVYFSFVAFNSGGTDNFAHVTYNIGNAKEIDRFRGDCKLKF